MDTSETYIKMCKRAEEIQEEWLPKLGDWCLSYQGVIELVTKSAIQVETSHSSSKPEYLTIQIATTFGKGGEAQNSQPDWKGHKSLRRYIWLPRQDQLQEILLEDIPIKRYPQLVGAFYKWIHESNYLMILPYGDGEATACPFFSMEQLWLAFVMKEKYDKVWTGEDWVTL